MEVFLGGGWHTFDPRNNARRIGRLMIARGRDAADVAISTAFGPSGLRLFRVWTDEIRDDQADAMRNQYGVLSTRNIRAA
jgi:transglutaminase-like putative cysteine protease